MSSRARGPRPPTSGGRARGPRRPPELRGRPAEAQNRAYDDGGRPGARPRPSGRAGGGQAGKVAGRAPDARERRAHTAQRQGGRTARGGDPAWAERLEAALLAPGYVQAAELGSAAALDALHHLHAYPARMHPATAHALIAALAGEAGGKDVLDPFCGSGTTLIEARRLGHRARGVDVSPLAVGIARAKTWTIDKERRKELRRAGKDIAADVVAAGKDARRAGFAAAPLRDVGLSPAARNKELGPWFMPHVRRELEDLAARIDEVAEDDAELAAVLRVPLSAILYKVSLRASDTDPSLVKKNIARGNTARMFGDRIEMLWDGLNALAHKDGPAVEVVLGDARRLDGAGVAPASVDAIVTSSPYAGTYDYVAQQGLRLAFFGVDARAHIAGEIGARGKLARDKGGLGDYRDDLGAVLREWVRVLKPGGLAALMIGDSLGGKEAVFADELINDVLPDELEALAWAWQERPKLGSAEQRAFGELPKREHILLARRLPG